MGPDRGVAGLETVAQQQEKRAFCYVAIKVGVCWRSHVEAFRRAEFKGSGADGAASELEGGTMESTE